VVNSGFSRQGWIKLFTTYTHVDTCRPPGNRFLCHTAANSNCLPFCRRGDGHRTTTLHPTINMSVQQYKLEQRMLQDEK
jgi:hypothetical protein